MRLLRHLRPLLSAELSCGSRSLSRFRPSDVMERFAPILIPKRQVINAFPLEGKGAHHGLSKFKKWIDGFDPLLDQV